jgi:undecaprenyl diphosphate synthase
MMQPQHIAIIMDGNGRWAELKGLARYQGHEAGSQQVKNIVRYARKIEIPFLTLFAFSSMNWGRPTEEVNALMNLLQKFLEEEESELIAQEIRLIGIGEREFLPSHILKLLQRVESNTAQGKKMTLTLAVSYDGRRDMVQAIQKLVTMAQNGALLAADVGEHLMMKQLSTSHCPDVDLLIRTSGEQRLSGFLPIEACYAELMFVDKLWPDFKESDLQESIDLYVHRERRFGLTSQQISACLPSS